MIYKYKVTFKTNENIERISTHQKQPASQLSFNNLEEFLLLRGNLKMTLSSIPFRQHREKKSGRAPVGKRFAVKEMPGKLRSAIRRSLDPCDNSNDSGLGFDHHTDNRHHIGIVDRLGWPTSTVKKPRLDVKVEHDEDNDGYCFPESIRASKENSSLIRTAPTNSMPSMGLPGNQHNSSGRAGSSCVPMSLRHAPSHPITLSTQLSTTSRFSDATLSIIKQPEQQHRARYQTEGSRGAVKDREGNGFPIVQLNGYYKPTTLQVFIGTDVGKVSPHMFYQACKVSGKNSTPCIERKIEGTCVIELQLDPTKDMTATCDCVGILKERNVDVEHRFPDQLGNRSKKKSTRCRMIFRTTLNHEDGRQETLQVCSHPIVCTQPPGVPEISKKSLTSCPATGGLELFVLGKNFSKDTKVYFQQTNDDRTVVWEQSCVPDKEFLQQTHFVCVVPPYRRPSITEPVSVRLFVVASSKASESHQFIYTPVNGAVLSVSSEATPQQTPFFNKMLWTASLSKREQDLSIMPPPETSMVPSASRRPSLSQSNETLSPPLHTLKQEYIDENSQNSVMDSNDVCQERYRHISESSLDVHHGDSNMSMINENSIDVMHHSSATTSDLLHHDNSNMSQNENSDLIVRRNSLSRSMGSVHENSLDVNVDNSNMTIVNEDSSCSNGMQCPVPSNQLFMGSNSLHQQNIGEPSHHLKEGNESKVMDLTVKFPMGTVADLVCNNSPSMATLQNFGINDSTSAPLPTQSGQSVENYLEKIRVKNSASSDSLLSGCFKNKIVNSGLLGNQNICLPLQNSTDVMSTDNHLARLPEPAFMSSQQSFVMENSSNSPMSMISKTEHMEEHKSPSLLQTTLSTTCQLDAFLNSTADHLMNSSSSSRSESVKDTQIPLVSTKNQPISMSPPSSLMVSSVMKPQISPSDNNSNHGAPSISTEVILNSQVSPTMMCHTSPSTLSQDSILPASNLCLSSMESNLIPGTMNSGRLLMQASPEHVSPSKMTSIPTTLPTQLSLATQEKEVILKAAVDLFQTQKKISNMECLSNENKEPMMGGLYMNNFLSIPNGSPNRSNVPTSTNISAQLQATSSGNFSIQTQMPSTSGDNFGNSTSNTEKADFTIPISVKEMQLHSHPSMSSAEKKIEDRMIPQGFTTLSENELINFINPSCFDQV
ncbi:nuclear factor of activated T-cells 5 isoform X3 [Coccinella septempunctata]|uniref:nuclear factor of activated T-cells 5 isoform X3 n=1 Tax=Coccinella septempunctata TaxID=41139 RepID=UPI001D07B17C|nr:nuclear factor of activated T-cells 5 isoform X3 [Coccinella septempunctata]